MGKKNIQRKHPKTIYAPEAKILWFTDRVVILPNASVKYDKNIALIIVVNIQNDNVCLVHVEL